MIAILILYALFHIACGVLAYGFHFAHFQRAYPSLAEAEVWDDAGGAMIGGLMGPLGLVAVLCCGFHDHGLLYRPSKR